MKNYNGVKWDEYFYYDVTADSGLRRKNDVLYHGSAKVRIPSGSSAGSMSFSKNGKPARWEVGLNSKSYSVHRIVYILMKGYIPCESIVDHLDGNPFNNKIDNLELKTIQGNNQNSSLRLDNTSGIVGVNYIVRRSGVGHFVANWWINGKQKSKNFSCRKYGNNAMHLAKEFRNEQVRLLNINGQSYTERHGTVNI